MRSLLFIALLAGAAHAGNNEIVIGSNVRALHSNSANALTDTSYAGGTVGFSRALDLELPYHLTLWADADANFGGTTGTMFSYIDTEVFAMSYLAGAHVRYQPFRGFAVGAGLAVGPQYESLKLVDSMSHSARDHGWGAAARASVRGEILFVDVPKLKMGFRVEYGYLAASGVELTPKQSMDDTTLHIPVTEASVGHLDLSGQYLTFGIVSQF